MIHRLWIGPEAPPFGFTDTLLRQLNPDLEVVEHRSVPPEVVKIAEQTAHLVMKDRHNQVRHIANIARLVLLRDYGGWWADHDLVPLVPFSTLPRNATAQHQSGQRCNCWMHFDAGHTDLDEALQHIQQQPVAPRKNATRVSGESMLSAVLGEDIGRLLLHVDFDGEMLPGSQPWAIHIGSNMRGRLCPRP